MSEAEDSRDEVEEREIEQALYGGAQLSSEYRLLIDDVFKRQLLSSGEDKMGLDLSAVYPIFSHLNSISRIRRQDGEVLALEVEAALLELETLAQENTLTPESVALLESLKIFGKYRIFDAVDGYKGRLITEHRRLIRVERPREEKSRGLLRWFR